ncbi:putative basic helix-loop-helix protein [Sesbania bispinosa]|nr:putative basic helix-loop-helix protein [Sesbania bispinosa]
MALSTYDMSQVTGIERSNCSNSMIATIDLGWNPSHPQIGTTLPPPLPSIMSCGLGALLSKLPSVIPSHNSSTQVPDAGMQSTSERVKIEDCGFDGDQKGKVVSLNK